MLRILPFCLILLSTVFTIKAQPPRQLSSSEIYQELLRLNTLGSVLYVAAHPDDENTRLISWLVGEQKFRTAYASLTRGDGGQNLIGKELGALLGVIRTQELLAARKVDGAEQYFTRAYDFGFSKNPEETLSIWNEDSVLTDLVVLIRTLRPDVMICRFPHTGEGGHGHHTASAILARKAFEKAADDRFIVPGGIPAWQVKKLYWNTFSFGTANTITEDQLKLEVGNFNPLLGQSYGEIASGSRSQHKSQGFGTATTRGSSKEHFVQWGGNEVKENLFEGLNTSWSRIRNGEQVSVWIDKAINAYDIKRPEVIVPHLLAARKAIQQLQLTREMDPEKAVWLKYKAAQLDALILQAAGVWTTAAVNVDEVVPGDEVEVKFEFIHRYSGEVSLEAVKVGDEEILKELPSPDNQLVAAQKKVRIPADASFSTPYWLEKEISGGLFHPVADRNGNAAQILKDKLVEVRFNIDGQPFTTQLNLQHRYVDPVNGEIFKPVVILPALTMQWSAPFLLSPNGRENEVTLRITAHQDNQSGKVSYRLPDQWVAEVPADQLSFNLARKGAVHEVIFQVKTKSPDAQNGYMQVNVAANGQQYHQLLTDIDYAHIPRQTVLTDVRLLLSNIQAGVQRAKIGYITGAGDQVAEAIAQLGYEVTEINEQNYAALDFSQFRTIVTGIRAYNTHTWLNNAYDKLMHYVQDGGNLVIQYNTNNRIGPLVAKMSPYELEITRDRVTVESAPVTFKDAQSPLLSSPNKISDQDFAGWVQERGIYYAGKKASEWNSVLTMNDPGEQPSEGSLVWAPYGKGTIIYTGLAFFRQLPAGVPGAYRLFVNLLEAGSGVQKAQNK